MKILFAVSEAVPFIKSGGLADVAGALSGALIKKGHDVRVMLPLYSAIETQYKEQMEFVKSVNVPLGWRNQNCGIKELELNKVKFYFLDNEYYFARSKIYGEYDDGERFAFFSKAVLECVSQMDFTPEIIHCHDWQTALIPLFKKTFYEHIDEIQNCKTVLTIHNLQYQGVFPLEIIPEVLGIRGPCDCLLFNKAANYLKAGIECCDALTTVSETYAQEITTPEHGHYLDGTIKYFAPKLRGIVNGIDVSSYSPNSDKALYKTYNKARMSGKALNKDCLLAELGLAPAPEAPVISMITRLVAHKGIDITLKMLGQLLEQDVRMIILGTGDWEYEYALTSCNPAIRAG